MEPFVRLEHRERGHHAVCDSPDCGSRTPEYRLVIGEYARYLCERCLVDVALEGSGRRDLAGAWPDAGSRRSRPVRRA